MNKLLGFFVCSAFLAKAQADPSLIKTALIELPKDPAHSERYLAGQALLMKSEAVLKECLKKADFAKKWNLSEEDALKKLAPMIRGILREGTDMIEVQIHGSTQEESELVLDHLTKAFVSAHQRRNTKNAATQLAALDTELQRQYDIVRDRRKALRVLIQQYGIPYFDGQKQHVGDTELSLYHTSRKKLTELKQDGGQLKIQTNKLLSTSKEDLIRTAAGLDLPDNRVHHYFILYRDKMAELSALQASGLGAEDPKIKALESQTKSALSNAEKEAVSLKEVLKARYRMVNEQINRMQEIVHDRQSNCIDLSMQQHNYSQAVWEYEQSLELFKDMKQQQTLKRVQINIPASYAIHKMP